MSLRIGDKPLNQLSDAELEAEAARRRRLRGRKGRGQPGAWNGPAPRFVRRNLAALELEEGASREDVETAYARLMAKYDPEKRRGDEKKYEAAKKLSRSLTEAYEAVVAYLG